MQWLETALDCGLSESDYWSMTLAEVIRATDSYNRRYRSKQREQAAFDYILADAIGRSISRLYSSSAKMPKLYELYPSLFDSAEIREQEQAKKEQLSALRFRQFADAFNKKHKEAQKKE